MAVRVSAGDDPVTGERIILTDRVMIERPGNSRSERTAFKEAEKLLTKLLAQADEQRVARTRTTVGAVVERWMSQHEVDSTTRMTTRLRSASVGVFGTLERPEALVLGRYRGERLRVVGHTSPLPLAGRAELRHLLQPQRRRSPSAAVS
jgi:hypothetical protein